MLNCYSILFTLLYIQYCFYHREYTFADRVYSIFHHNHDKIFNLKIYFNFKRQPDMQHSQCSKSPSAKNEQKNYGHIISIYITEN